MLPLCHRGPPKRFGTVNQPVGNHELESSSMVRFDIEPLLQGQMRIDKPKSAYNSHNIGPGGLGWQSNL